MSRPGTPSAKTAGSRSHKEDVLQFLDNLDSFEGSGSPSKDAAASTSKAGTLSSRSVAPSAATTATPGDNADDPQAVLDFLDEIVANRDRRSATPSNNTSSSATTGGKKAATSGSTAGASSVSRSTSRTTLRDGETSAAGTARSARDKDAAVPSRKSGESARSLNMTAASSSSAAGQAATKLQEAPLPEESSPAAEAPKAGGWGWGSVWSQASNVLQQAKTVAEEVSHTSCCTVSLY